MCVRVCVCACVRACVRMCSVHMCSRACLSASHGVFFGGVFKVERICSSTAASASGSLSLCVCVCVCVFSVCRGLCVLVRVFLC